MIRIAAFSDDLAGDFSRAVALAQRLELQGLELRNLWGRGLADLTEGDIRSVRQSLQGTGIEITCLSSPYGRSFWIDDPEAKRRNEQILEKMIRFADLLGVPMIRVFALWMPGYHGREDWARRPVFTPELVAQVADRMAASVRRAEEAGVVLVIENEGESYGGTCCEMGQIVRALASPAARACWDLTNGWRAGEVPYPDGYSHIRGLVQHVHIKDCFVRAGNPRLAGENAVVGTGSMPLHEILTALRADGYDGWAVVERHFHPRDPEAVPELQALSIGDIRGLQSLVARLDAC